MGHYYRSLVLHDTRRNRDTGGKGGAARMIPLCNRAVTMATPPNET